MRPPPPLFRSALAAGAAVLPLVIAPAALAQSKLDARYTITMTGVPVGESSWSV